MAHYGIAIGLVAVTVTLSEPVAAQQVYGPGDASAIDEDVPQVLVEPRICEEEVREDGTIVVCREQVDTERYMSPVPRPVDGNRGLRLPPDVSTLPPCIHAPPLSICAKLGRAPPPVPMVDTTAFPEPLSEAEAALVRRTDQEPSGGEPEPVETD